MAAENQRILLKGTAGTGKTLLSLEHARRYALTGKKVLFLCFNHNLSRYLQIHAKNSELPQVDNLQVDTLHSYLIRHLEQNTCLPSRIGFSSNEYFGRIIPDAFLNIAEQGKFEVEYDTLIIDEGQDLLRLDYIVCMDAIIRGGLKDGRWPICYDPNQNIYNPELNGGLEIIQEYRPVILNLDINCRNTREIGIYNVLATGMPPTRYFKIRGEGIVREGYDDFADERKRIIRVLKKLLAQGVSPGNICLLSRYRFENSCLQGTNIFQGICRFQNITDVNPALIVEDSLRFCTIHSFKGLESQVVFLLDVDNFTDHNSRLLNYIAISRATSQLYIFYSKDIDSEWERLVQESASLLEMVGE